MCEIFSECKHLMPGRGCCVCNAYNGAWRDACAHCGAPACDDVPVEALRTEWDRIVAATTAPEMSVANLRAYEYGERVLVDDDADQEKI